MSVVPTQDPVESGLSVGRAIRSRNQLLAAYLGGGFFVLIGLGEIVGAHGAIPVGVVALACGLAPIYPHEGEFAWHEVSKRVNHADNDDTQLLLPITTSSARRRRRQAAEGGAAQGAAAFSRRRAGESVLISLSSPRRFVGWAKARSAVPTMFVVPKLVGTLRFAHPTCCGRASFENIQRGVLQQHDGLGVGDAAVGDHRERFVDRKLQHLDVLAFVREAAAAADPHLAARIRRRRNAASRSPGPGS